MQVSYCDVCQNVIKTNTKKYAFLVQEIKETKSKVYKDYWEYIQDLNRNYEQIIVKEICEECKKVYDYLLNIRLKELEEIKKQIEQSYKLKWRKR